jgi:hypothetical protein
MKVDLSELRARLMRGADHLESEGDLGLPVLLREAAGAVAERDRLREGIQAYLDAFDAGTGTVYLEPRFRALLTDNSEEGR